MSRMVMSYDDTAMATTQLMSQINTKKKFQHE